MVGGNRTDAGAFLFSRPRCSALTPPRRSPGVAAKSPGPRSDYGELHKGEAHVVQRKARVNNKVWCEVKTRLSLACLGGLEAERKKEKKTGRERTFACFPVFLPCSTASQHTHNTYFCIFLWMLSYMKPIGPGRM